MNQSKYDKLEIPKELSCIVNDARGKRKNKGL